MVTWRKLAFICVTKGHRTLGAKDPYFFITYLEDEEILAKKTFSLKISYQIARVIIPRQLLSITNNF